MLKKITYQELQRLMLAPNHRHHFQQAGEIEADFQMPSVTGVLTLRGHFLFCLHCPTVYFRPINPGWRAVEIVPDSCYGDYWKG